MIIYKQNVVCRFLFCCVVLCFLIQCSSIFAGTAFQVGNWSNQSFEAGYYTNCGGNYTFLCNVPTNGITINPCIAPPGAILAINQVPVSGWGVGGNNVYFSQTFRNTTIYGYANGGTCSCSGQTDSDFINYSYLSLFVFGSLNPSTNGLTAGISGVQNGATIINYTNHPAQLALTISPTELNTQAIVTQSLYDGSTLIKTTSTCAYMNQAGKTLTSDTWSLTITNPTPGNHSYWAQMTDTYGASATTSNLTITVIDVTPPTVTIAGTATNTVVSSLNLQDTATSNDPGEPIVNYSFFVSGLGCQLSNNTGNWSPTNLFGTWSIYASATDGLGITGYSQTNTYIISPSLSPIVVLTNPANGQVISPGQVTISGSVATFSGNPINLTAYINSASSTEIIQPISSTAYVLFGAGTPAANGLYLYWYSSGVWDYYNNPVSHTVLYNGSRGGYTSYVWSTNAYSMLYQVNSMSQGNAWSADYGANPPPTSSTLPMYIAAFSTSPSAPIGSNSVVIQAQCNGYTAYSVTNTFLVDAAPTNVSITPINNSSFTNIGVLTVQLTGTIAGLPATFITYDGTNAVNTNSTGAFNWTKISLGTHQLWCKIVDNYGLTGLSQTNVFTFITNNPPIITLLTPTNGFNGTISTPVLVTGTATNGDGHAVSVNIYTNGSLAGTASVIAGRYTNNLVTYSGTNTIFASATSDGFTVYSATNLFYTEGAPTVTWLSPNTGTNIWSYNPTWQVQVTDPLARTNGLFAYYYDNSTYIGKSSITNSYALPHTNLLTTGTHSLLAVVTNAAGLSTRITNYLTILADRPPTNVVLSAPQPSTNQPGATVFQALATDPDGDPITMVFYDGATPMATNTSPPFTNSVYLGVGTHPIHATAYSTSFAVSTATNVLTFAMPPFLQWLNPTSSVTQYSTNSLQVFVSGTFPFVVNYTNNGVWIGTSSNGINNYAVDWTPDTAGTNLVVATAIDSYRITTTSTNVVIVNRQDPVITWLSPTGQVTQFDQSSLQVSVTGNAPFSVSYATNGVWFRSNTNSSNHYAITIQNTAVGTNQLIASATDAYGLTSFCTNMLTVVGLTNDATKPGQTSVYNTTCGGSCPTPGMAVYRFHAMKASLHVEDTPVIYQPPYGPSVVFSITYNSREEGQPAVMPFSNLGAQWSINCVSYIEDDPENTNAFIRCFIPGGGFDQYPSVNQYDSKTGAYLEALISGGYLRHLPDGSSMTYDLSDGAASYPRRFFMTHLTDSLGNALTFNYQATNSAMQLVSITDASGLVSTLQHDSDGHVSSFTDPFGHAAVLTYTNGELASITDPAGITSSFQYNGNFMTALTTPYGQTTFATSVTNGCRTLTATDPLAQTEAIQYYYQAAPTTLNAPTGVLIPADTSRYITAYWSKKAYALGAFPKIIQWSTNGASTEFVQDAPAWTQDELGNQTFYNYQGQLAGGGNGTVDKPAITAKRLSNGSSQIEAVQYTADGRPTTISDAVGHTTTLTYTGTHLSGVSKEGITLLAVGYGGTNTSLPVTITNNGTVIQNAFNGYGQVTSQTDAAGNTVNYSYDAYGYPQSITGPLGFSTYLTYSNAVLQNITDESGYTVQYAYDGLNRLTNTTYPDSTTEAVTYNNLDAVNFKDRQGGNTIAVYDALRRMTSSADPGGLVSSFSYCTCGALDGITDPKQQSTSWPLDIVSRPTLKGYADGTVETPSYDPVTSQVLGITDAAGKTTSFSYYINGALAGVTYATGTPSVAYSYDSADRLTTMTDGIGTSTISYVPEGQPGAGEVAGINGPASVIAYAYDSRARPYSVSVNEDVTTVYRDALGRITNSSSSLDTNSIAYDGASSRPVTVTGSAIASHYSYTAVNDGSKLQTVEHDGSVGLLMAFSYAYDTLGRITNTTETNSDGVTTWAYGYDASDRLTSATEQGLFNHTYVYTYDSAGNRTSEQIDGVTSAESANSVNQLTNQSGTSFTYDLAGNETTKVGSGGGFVFEWDGANRCTAIGSSDSQFGLAYDGLNRWTHITQCDSDCTNLLADRWFIWNGNTLAEERASNGDLMQRFYANGFWRAGTNYFYIRDHLGSVRQVLDQTGLVVAKFDYDPYGRRTQTFGTMWVDYGYAGLFELPNGLKLAVWRIYDPSTGRWINRDPIRENGGWNMYAYCGGEPVNKLDPSGTTWIYSQNPFSGSSQFVAGGLNWRYMQDGSSKIKPLQNLSETTLQGELAFQQDRLKNKPHRLFLDIWDERGFDSNFFEGKCADDRKYYQYNGDVFSDNELNYIGIGMYEAWLGSDKLEMTATIRAWKSRYVVMAALHLDVNGAVKETNIVNPLTWALIGYDYYKTHK